MKKLHLLFAGLLVCGALFMSSCNETNDNPVKPTNPLGIPNDADAKPNPILDLTKLNTVLANFNSSISYVDGQAVFRLDLTGVKDPYTGDWVELFGTNHPNQNIWVSVGDYFEGFDPENFDRDAFTPKGFTIEKVSNQDQGVADLIFLVDNSGSMNEEANAISDRIKEWAATLEKNMTIRFACVGYSISGSINGAIDFTSAENLKQYLGEKRGTSSTVGFAGANASSLKAEADKLGSTGEECGVMALKFADQNFSFRYGANRIYVNFTDEPNQPGGNANYSTEWVKKAENWPATKGTIHTVYSGNTNFSEIINKKEFPWNLSSYTGGYPKFASSSFSGVTLDDLHVTGAIENSYIIRFSNGAELLDGKVHILWITVYSTSPNGQILADRKYPVIFNQ